MRKDPSEMMIEELDASYGQPQIISAITHVLALHENFHHDRFTIEVVTEVSQRLQIQFTQSALQALVRLIGDRVNVERPKCN